MLLRSMIIALSALLLVPVVGSATEGSLQFDYDPQGRFDFSGVMGERVRANTDHWLVRAPAANPGLLAMFHLRDRKPVPNLVPWAGEFWASISFRRFKLVA